MTRLLNGIFGMEMLFVNHTSTPTSDNSIPKIKSSILRTKSPNYIKIHEDFDFSFCLTAGAMGLSKA